MMKTPELHPIEKVFPPGRTKACQEREHLEEHPVAHPLAISQSRDFLFHFTKRTADLLLVVLAIVLLLSWLLPLLCLLVWLDSGGPVFFIQERIGWRGRPFQCFKLRTMTPVSGSNKKAVSRLGRFLRYRKLDELPQLFNVLLGEMSLIGPRPHMISDHRQFSEAIGRRYHCRHEVLPGITGLAQVLGYEGPITSHYKLRGRVRLDLFYIKRRSIGLECWIFWKTLSLLFRPAPAMDQKPIVK